MSKKLKTILIIILIILFYPLGLLVMWLGTTWKKWLKILITIPFILVILYIILWLFFIRPFHAVGRSMLPTIKENQLLFVNLPSRFVPQQRGTIILFKRESDRTYFARIVGLPGEKIMVNNGKVYINRRELSESYLPFGIKTYGSDFLAEGQEVVIPQGAYFVLGDNRPFSLDSRGYGFISQKKIVGSLISLY